MPMQPSCGLGSPLNFLVPLVGRQLKKKPPEMRSMTTGSKRRAADSKVALKYPQV